MASVRRRRVRAPALASATMERRSNGLLRVPFVRLCRLDFDDGRAESAFLVNINVLGGYIAQDVLPSLGQDVLCQFGIPGTEREVTIKGVVAWVNPRQQHPVHSLPPGFGVRFLDLSREVRHDIERVIEEYVAGRPQR